jgi:hypothetical protein
LWETPTAAIGGSTVVGQGVPSTWSAVVYGAGWQADCGGFSFEWQRRPTGQPTWSAVVGTTCQYTGTLSEPTDLKLTATAVGSAPIVATLSVGMAPQQPTAVTDLGPDLVSPHEIWLTWTAPAVAWSTLAEYDLRFGPVPITGSNFLSSSRLATDTPLEPGETEFYGAAGLQSNTTYYFAVKTRNAAGQWSDLSNVTSAKTLTGGGGGAAAGIDGGTEGVATGLSDPMAGLSAGGRQGSVASSAGARRVAAWSTEASNDSTQAVVDALLAECAKGDSGLVIRVFRDSSASNPLAAVGGGPATVLQRAGPDGEWRTVGKSTALSAGAIGFYEPRLTRMRYVVPRVRMSVADVGEVAGRAPIKGWTLIGAGSRVSGSLVSAAEVSTACAAMSVCDTIECRYSPANGAPEAAPRCLVIFGDASRSVAVAKGVLSRPTDSAVPELVLREPRPNPTEHSLTISFSLSKTSPALLDVHDVQGRLVKELRAGSIDRGDHEVLWDLRDEGGRVARAGVYFVRLRAEGRTFLRRVAVLGL